MNETFCYKFVPKGPVDNNPAMVYIMAWCRIGDKPLSEPMLTVFTDAYMWHCGNVLNYSIDQLTHTNSLRPNKPSPVNQVVMAAIVVLSNTDLNHVCMYGFRKVCIRSAQF